LGVILDLSPPVVLLGGKPEYTSSCTTEQVLDREQGGFLFPAGEFPRVS